MKNNQMYTTHLAPTEVNFGLVRSKSYHIKKNELVVCKFQLVVCRLQMKAKDDKISELLQTIQAKDAEIQFDQQTMKEQEAIDKKKKQEIEQMAQNIVELNAVSQFDRQTRTDLTAIVKEKNSVIDRLKNTINQLRNNNPKKTELSDKVKRKV